jgi:hypothetical protein
LLHTESGSKLVCLFSLGPINLLVLIILFYFISFLCCFIFVYISFCFVCWGGVEPSTLLLRPLDGILYKLQMMRDHDECAAFGGMLGSRN